MQKTIIILFSLIYINVDIHSQELAFIEKGKSWYVFYDVTISGGSEDNNRHYRYYFDTDSLINGYNCVNMYKEDTERGTASYLCSIYEKEGKVYIVKSRGVPSLLYDFTLSVGDNLSIGNSIIHVISIEKKIIEGIERKIFILSFNDGYTFEWIEGIGSMYAPTDPIPLEGIYSDLQYCYLDEKVIFNRNNYLTWVKNIEYNHSSDLLYDLSGRRLTSPPERGIYIQGGKLRVK